MFAPPNDSGKGEARQATGLPRQPQGDLQLAAAPGASALRGPVIEPAGGLCRASLTLSDIDMGHRNAVIITGSLLRALGSHAFSVAIFT